MAWRWLVFLELKPREQLQPQVKPQYFGDYKLMIIDTTIFFWDY